MQKNYYTFFNTLEYQTQEFLKKNTTKVSIPKGTLLSYQGEICQNILRLTSGKVRLFRQEEGLSDITIYTLKAGEQCIVNTVSLLTNTGAVASAETLTDIQGYFINRQNLKELSRISKVYNNYLCSLYQNHFQTLIELVGSIQFKSMDKRILEWLEQQPTKKIPITHHQLASELGSTRATVSRILKDLEHKGLLTLYRGRIELL